ncbi:E3 ubiquitin-protein ligase MARCHF7-like isoform X2 [Paramormyrops kingsleyae]|uniref:E3 ubiquitin-protein ligase MARCHF7-like isoform X2 n=1 Tax=Paramormyrops kingsleyae TaxID=1676925 RepID=UPI000CD5E475|nr:E3 ubiquitin-protein ligase MARCH7-like isoform X2 [Paramormyrops kingsleyae]
MDSRPFRLTFTPPGATSLSPSSTRLGTSRLHSRGRTLASDGYTRASSIKLDSDLEGSRFSSSREYGISDSRRSSWKVSSALTAVTSCDRPWADSPVGSRSRLGGSEPLGTCSGFLNGTQDSDMKRAKISYCSRTPFSREPCSPVLSGAYCNPDPSWQVRSTRSRSSSSSPSEGGWSRREHDGLSMQAPRAAGLASSLYPERAVSSYAQGARPKESFTSGQASATTRRRTGHYEPSPLSRDPCRPATPWAGPSRSRSWYTSSAGSSETTGSSTSAPRRQAADSGSPEGRCATRQLLSRLASSMSSTLFSRRPSQDSSSSDSASCSFDSLEDSADAQREESSPTSASSSRNSSTDSSQGLPFLRRRHHAVRETHAAEADPEPPRAGTSWLSSSLRSRCTPLFSCRRREGLQEDEARQPYRSSPFPLRRRASPETKATDQEEGEDDEEEPESAGVVGSPGATGASNTTVPCPPHAGRARRMAGVTPNSLFHVSVSPSLESSLPDNVMITVDIMATGRSGPEMEKPSSSRDPEKLRKIKESLLLEESDEEGDLCRICQMAEESPSNPLIAPCRCTGSLQYVHQDCMKKWLSSKISSGSALDTITTCELCKEKLQLNIDNFDINELYRMRERSENEFISCGLYLVVLLHLCEQRFSDVLGAANDAGVRDWELCRVRAYTSHFFNMARTLHEYMDELESSNGDSEEEVPDRRPAIHFCDLDDDDDEEDY